jgi:hypothetical protein
VFIFGFVFFTQFIFLCLFSFVVVLAAVKNNNLSGKNVSHVAVFGIRS